MNYHRLQAVPHLEPFLHEAGPSRNRSSQSGRPGLGGFRVCEDRVLDGPILRAPFSSGGSMQDVRTGSWMGPPQGKRAPRVGPSKEAVRTRCIEYDLGADTVGHTLPQSLHNMGQARGDVGANPSNPPWSSRSTQGAAEKSKDPRVEGRVFRV